MANELSAELQEKARKIQVLLMDVDGVLTDGRLYNIPFPDGKILETKAFDSQDGIALQWLSWHGILTGVISGRISPATEERARQAKMKYVYQGHIEKIPILDAILADAKVAPENVAFIGDDFTDVVIFNRVGLSFATANAREEVKRSAQFTTTAKGGEGAVREVCEILLKARGLWPEILKKYEIHV